MSLRTVRFPLPMTLIGLLLASGAGCGSPEPATADRVDKGPAPQRSAPPRKALDPEKVAWTLRGRGNERSECFLRGGARDGFVRLQWDIDAAGSVEEVRVIATSVHQPKIESCLADIVRSVPFTVPEPAQASWTFVQGLPEVPGAREVIEKKKKAFEKRYRRVKKKDRPSLPEDGVRIEKSSEGWLQPDVVESTVMGGQGLYARCFREGLSRNPALSGVARLRIVIDEDGRVAAVLDSGSDIPDPGVLNCVAEGIFALEFPEPRDGDVKVYYGIVFNAG